MSENKFDQDWYEEAPDPLAPLRARGILARENKEFSEDPDFKYHENLRNSMDEKSSGKPNEPSRNYDLDEMPTYNSMPTYDNDTGSGGRL